MFPKEAKILTVDDQAVMRMMVRRFLRELGYQNVVQADDGAKAWPLHLQAIADEKPFDLIIADMQMPHTTGLELLQLVREAQAGADIPFILLTAETDRGAVVKALELKVDSYIKKPLQFKVFQEKLAEVYEKRFKPAA